MPRLRGGAHLLLMLLLMLLLVVLLLVLLLVVLPVVVLLVLLLVVLLLVLLLVVLLVVLLLVVLLVVLLLVVLLVVLPVVVLLVVHFWREWIQTQTQGLAGVALTADAIRQHMVEHMRSTDGAEGRYSNGLDVPVSSRFNLVMSRVLGTPTPPL